MPFLAFALVALLLVAVVVSRANELFVLSARDGRVLLLRGKVPRDLERELGSLLRQARATGQLRAVRRGGATRLVGRGLSAELEQRLRNVFFASRFAKLRWLGGRDGRPRNLGQRLGWDWLAWRLAGSPPERGALRVVGHEAESDDGSSNGALRESPEDPG